MFAENRLCGIAIACADPFFTDAKPGAFSQDIPMGTFSLDEHQLAVSDVLHNPPPSSLYEHAIRYEKDASIADNGALVAYSGAKTGRSPKDKRVVRHSDSERDVWWGPVNIPLRRRERSRSTASARSTT